MLLDRLHRIVSVLNAHPDWAPAEWKSLVDVTLSDCVKVFRLDIGPDMLEERDSPPACPRA